MENIIFCCYNIDGWCELNDNECEDNPHCNGYKFDEDNPYEEGGER